MYTQVNKSKQNSFPTNNRQESRAVANSVGQKKCSGKQGFGFVDNRPKAIAQTKIRILGNNHFSRSIQRENRAGMLYHNAGVIQRVTTITVKNTTDNYSSGWIQAETQSTGVEDEPRKEAKAVQAIAGGTWVGGHMVNDRLGGTGGFENIVPITASMNNRHHTIENAAQNMVGNGGTPYEVNYHMQILHRDDYTFTPSRDKVNNLPDKFQQSYDWRTKEVKAGGTINRPIPYRASGPITNVKGKVLDW